MIKAKITVIAASMLAVFAGGVQAHSSGESGFEQASLINHADIFMPENNLHLRHNAGGGNISEAEFNRIIDEVNIYYEPLVNSHGANLVWKRNWNDDTVNAYAMQQGNNWIVSMFGGLARAPEVTADGFALVVCHELGHHLGGFPFKGTRWASSEGQSDYFASHSCAKKIWSNDDNSQYRYSVHPTAKRQCDATYGSYYEQNLCYRTSMAGLSLAKLLAAGRGQHVSFDDRDRSVVSQTYENHPQPQCRLDTYVEGALCKIEDDSFLIPGKDAALGRQSIYAELESARNHCASISKTLDVPNANDAFRPKCWYKPRLVE
ncbi:MULTISPECIES: hypothetical protein [Pseudoalteromonas]|uniref:Peptidase M48 domain-containing protein n=1 Tax=Pseudoalteromonas amylolytica TaxID=1859457 RepID=A0A1S1MQ77_9GAMM|nr:MULTISPECIES: hypothetical protein [Pseudoalteromonas]OHU86987.1 hypothetical protein BFC16_13045 [Pseudoalteromonas sp. JW3]OHU88304.1 hypothetical protein BET10_19715 [Pseudoalteromonas amylolytica]